MEKRLLDSNEYKFFPQDKKIRFFDSIQEKEVLLITNLTDNIIIYK